MNNVLKSQRRWHRVVCSGACTLAAVFVLASTVVAQTYPVKPIKVIIPWPAGGPTDVVSRILMQPLSERLGQPIVIDNRPGGGGIIGLTAIARSTPDGYALLIADIGGLTVLPALRSELPYDSLRDFQPISLMVSASLVLCVPPEMPVKSLQEFVAYAKAHPGKLTYGSIGQGSSAHMAAELLRTKTSIDMVHVPYKGGPPLLTDLLGGRIDVGFLGIAATPQHINSGQLRPLAVTSRKRSSMLPNLPSIAETYPDYDVSTWTGLLAPAGTPRTIVDRLQKEIAAIVNIPEIVGKLKSGGQEPEGSTPDEYALRIKNELMQWKNLVKTAGIRQTE